jgi:phage terminase large subunit-like protein
MSDNGDHEGTLAGHLRGLHPADLPGRAGGAAVRETAVAPGLRPEIPGSAPGGIDGVDAYKGWSAEAQQKALDMLRTARATRKIHRPFYCPAKPCDGKPHDEWDWPHARSNQHPPPVNDDWLTWLICGGRGSGKTRAGAELTHRMTRIAPRMALIGPTGPDIREYMVEGESGILATQDGINNPVQWEPSKRKLTWRNGAIALTFSAEEPDRLRGPQHYFAWIDEPSHMALINDVWDNLLLGLRLGTYPRICATTTPTPIPWMRSIIGDPLTRTVRATTYANLDNLAEPFKRTILSRYEGTRLGRQELHGEILEDVEGALWTWSMIDGGRLDIAPPLDRIVIGIDPAGTARKRSSETGIVVVGVADDHLYVLADHSGRMSPNRWASVAMSMVEFWQADALVAEKNFGGDMVITTLRSIDATPRIIPVTSRRGKALRAEPLVSLYEQGRVHHIGAHSELEDQMTSWVPGEGESPDRVDALVHAATELVKTSRPVQVSDPRRLRLVANNG